MRNLNDFLNPKNILREKDYILLSECNHSYKNKLSPYHLEDNCLTHTELVLNEMNNIIKEYPEYNPYILLLSSLFHDIGKPEIGFIKNDRKLFTGHEFLSSLKFLEYAKELKQKFNLSDKDIEYITLSILYHTIAHKDNHYIRYFEFYNYLRLLSIADNRGRITQKKNEEYPLLDRLELKEKNKNNEIILMFGLVGSGKSTYINNNYKDQYIISRDSLIEEFRIKNNIDSYNEAYRIIHSDKTLLNELNREFQKSISKARKYNKIVVDMTNLTKKSRKQFISQFRKTHKIIVNVMLLPYSEIIKRNKKRKGKDLSHILLDMIRKTTIPNYDENIDKINFIIQY